MRKLLAYILAALVLLALVPTASARYERAGRELDGPPEMTYLGEYRVTGYDPYCTHCCGKCDGITASGAIVTEGYTVAMCRDIPFGTKIYIEGLGVFEVQDRGVGRGKIDIALGSHKECYKVTGWYRVWVVGGTPRSGEEGGKT